MNICLFSKEEILEPLKISDERAEHILKILHKKEGDTFTAGIIGGQSGIATITKIEFLQDKTKGNLYFNFEPKEEGKLLKPLIMIIGFPRPIQLKRLLRDIAALGVSQVHLTGTELGEKSYMQSNLVQNGSAYKMLLDGTVQAGSTHVPQIFLHKSLKECLNFLQEVSLQEYSYIYKIALDNVNPKCELRNIFTQGKNNVLSIAAIGSERGWTDKERTLLEERGFERCGMGNRIMRTETASTVAASIILDRLELL